MTRSTVYIESCRCRIVTYRRYNGADGDVALAFLPFLMVAANEDCRAELDEAFCLAALLCCSAVPL